MADSRSVTSASAVSILACCAELDFSKWSKRLAVADTAATTASASLAIQVLLAFDRP